MAKKSLFLSALAKELPIEPAAQPAQQVDPPAAVEPPAYNFVYFSPSPFSQNPKVALHNGRQWLRFSQCPSVVSVDRPLAQLIDGFCLLTHRDGSQSWAEIVSPTGGGAS